MDQYIDFGVAPYALPKVCEALWNNGVHNAFLTMEDGDIHVRWKYDINRGIPQSTKSNNLVGDPDKVIK
jgi:hypothetical protein